MDPDMALGGITDLDNTMIPGGSIGHPYQAWPPVSALALDINMVSGFSIHSDITTASGGSTDLCGPQ